MKTPNYTFAKAPALSVSRTQAIGNYLGGSTLDEAGTLAVVRAWADGLDTAETPEGEAFRARVAGTSEVVIQLLEPPAPPAPPVMVTVSMQQDDAAVLAALARGNAKLMEGEPHMADVATQLLRAAKSIEAAAPVATQLTKEVGNA